MSEKELPRYDNCTFSLFISFATDDNENYWITDFKKCIERQLEKGLGSSQIKNPFFSADINNRIVSGKLSDELEQAIQKSFAMLIVIGEKYHDSPICQKELEFFYNFYGEDGITKRLYLATMTSTARNKIKENAYLNAVKENNNVPAIPIYTENSNTPIRTTREGVAGTPPRFDDDFWLLTKRITKDLIDKIEKDRLATHETNQTIKPLPPKINVAGFCVANEEDEFIQTQIRILQQKFEEKNFECKSIDKKLFNHYDKDDSNSLEPILNTLRKFDVLIVVFHKGKTAIHVPGVEIGGHLGVLKKAWKKLGKKQEILWFNPFKDKQQENNQSEYIADKHLKFIEELKPLQKSTEDICAKLFGDYSENGEILIRIGNPKDILVHDPLAEKIGRIWDDLKEEIKNGLSKEGKPSPAFPKISCTYLDTRYVEDQCDAHGYVVVITPGILSSKKSIKEIVKNVDETVRSRHKQKFGLVFPGRVASIKIVEQEASIVANDEIPEDRWSVIECKILGPNKKIPDDIELCTEDENSIKQLLKWILNKYQHQNLANSIRA